MCSMDNTKPIFPSLFSSYTNNHRLESFQFEYSPAKKKLSPDSNNPTKEQTHAPSIANLSLPLFNSHNTTIENFDLNNLRPHFYEADNSIHIGRYINNKEMLSKLIYSKTMLKDNRLNFDNKVIDNHFIPSSMPLFPYYTLRNKIDSTLIFESRFESGNLLAAFKVGLYSYELLLSNDTNTSGFNKWFFFRVTNMIKDRVYNLAIINNLRQNKQYSNGIKIYTYSMQKNRCSNIGWHHSGKNVSLIPNEIYQFTNNKRVSYNTLSFSFNCEYDDDTIYFANCIPYTYTKLMRELSAIKDRKLSYYHQGTLCKSLGGNDLEYFRIDSKGDDGNDTKEKEGIVLFARQHPSETVGSWVMKGVIDLLTGDSEEAKYIQDNFEILVIPMVNIDGVIAGNSRTSYAGCDLNRKWKHMKKHKHPEIYFIKEIIRHFVNRRKVMCLVDFHGHLSAFNSFFYSNYDENDINKARAFPYACAKNSPAINFDQCVFSMMKYKQGSSRINMYTEFGIENSCTLETSSFGFDKGKYSFQYINESILKEIGRDVCLGIITYHYYKRRQLETGPISISSAIKTKIEPIVSDLEEGKMNIKQEDFNDQNNCNSEDDGNNNTGGEQNIQCNEEIDEGCLPKLKSVRLKRIKIQITNWNMINPKAISSTINLNSIIDIKSNDTIIKSKSNMHLPVKQYQVPLSSSLNESTVAFDQSNINPLSDKTRLRYKRGFRLKDTDRDNPSLPNQPELFIPSLKHINSVFVQNKNRSIHNLATLPPYPNKKFYATRDVHTQTESIFFDSKLIYYIGSYKILKFKYTKENVEQNRNRFNIKKSLTFKEDNCDKIKLNKESKWTQTRSSSSLKISLNK